MSVSEHQNLEETKRNSIVDEIESAVSRARENMRELRVTSLGLLDKANAEAKSYIDNVKKRGEAKLPEKAESAAEEAENMLKRISQSLEDTLNQTRALSTAAYEEAADNGKRLTEWVKQAFDEIESETEAEKEEAISRIGRSIEKANAAFNRLYTEMKDSSEELLKEAKELGKDVDYEFRKALFGRQESLESRIQSFWKAIGLVNKQEMEEVNRKLVALAASLENQLDEESRSLVYLNRRKTDRRVKQVPVRFDKRVRARREEDKDRMAS